MANPLFTALAGNSPMGNMLQMLTQLQHNPLSLLGKAGFNIPNNLNNPQQIVQYLTQSGQINQNQLNQAQQMAQILKMSGMR